MQLTKQELTERKKRLLAQLDEKAGEWDTALFVSKVNQYYLTGTMQDGVAILRKNGEITLFARKSYARAKEESLIDDVLPMRSYKDIAEKYADMGKTLIETEVMPVAMLDRMKKYLVFETVEPVDGHILNVRAEKSAYELSVMHEAGKRHNMLLTEEVPNLLKEGISETEFQGRVYEKMLQLGHMGVSRWQMFQGEVGIGQFGFGERSYYPSSFNGPGGMQGAGAWSPSLGSEARLLKKNDLVFLDAAFGFHAYHTDKTQMYFMGENLPAEAAEKHAACQEVLKSVQKLMKPGVSPMEIYNEVMESLPSVLDKNFMGYETVKFLGHGVGLQVDEMPVIANGFKAPLVSGITLAVEPKIAVEGFGLVGVEETLVVTENGGACLTGGARGIIRIVG